MFPPGTRVRFCSTLGEQCSTVDAVLDDHIEGDYIHRVKPDGAGLPLMLLLGRQLRPEDDAVPIIVEGA